MPESFWQSGLSSGANTGLAITPPLLIVAIIAKTGQASGVNPVIAFALQSAIYAPLFFEEQGPQVVVLNIEASTGGGQVDMGMLPELAAINVQGAENSNFNTHFAGKAEHGRDGAAKQLIEQWSVQL